MLIAKIYQPAKSSMQSGRAKISSWVLEFEQTTPKKIDELMGWCGSGDVYGQIKIIFSNKSEAIAFAKVNKITYRVAESKKQRYRAKNYSENFSFNRLQPWSH